MKKILLFLMIISLAFIFNCNKSDDFINEMLGSSIETKYTAYKNGIATASGISISQKDTLTINIDSSLFNAWRYELYLSTKLIVKSGILEDFSCNFPNAIDRNTYLTAGTYTLNIYSRKKDNDVWQHEEFPTQFTFSVFAETNNDFVASGSDFDIKEDRINILVEKLRIKVNWETNYPVKVDLEYSANSDLSSSTVISSSASYYGVNGEIIIEGLSEGNTIYFKLIYKTEAGVTKESSIKQATTKTDSSQSYAKIIETNAVSTTEYYDTAPTGDYTPRWYSLPVNDNVGMYIDLEAITEDVDIALYKGANDSPSEVIYSSISGNKTSEALFLYPLESIKSESYWIKVWSVAGNITNYTMNVFVDKMLSNTTFISDSKYLGYSNGLFSNYDLKTSYAGVNENKWSYRLFTYKSVKLDKNYDTSMEYEFSRESGSSNYAVSMFLQFIDTNNMLVLSFTSDQYYSIHKIENSFSTIIYPWTKSELIKINTDGTSLAATNKVSYKKIGTRLFIYINDQVATTLDGFNYLEGEHQVGIATFDGGTGSSGEELNKLTFKNLALTYGH